MADEATKDAAVVGGAYKESDTHVPDPTDLYGTFNTSGTGAHHDPATVSPIFDVDRQATAQQIVAALDPEDDSVAESTVLFSEPQAVVSADHEGEREALLEKAKARLADGPVEVGGDTHLDKEAAQSGEEGARAAARQEAATASDTSSTAGSHTGTEMTGTVDTTGTGGPTDAGQVSNVPAAADQGSDEGEADQAPAESANKPEWEAWARKKGATDADLEGKTKADLIKDYGSK